MKEMKTPENIFLDKVAFYIYQNYSDILDECVLIFPGKRASVFFTSYLSKYATRPVWNPKVYTINEFFAYLSGLNPADNITLLIILYKVFREVKQSNESFDDFYYWGEMLLNDFDDIDKYMVNTGDIFQNLSSLKSIEEHFDYLLDEQVKAIQQFWRSFMPGKTTGFQDDFIRLWEVLEELYKRFNEYLTRQNLTYEGMMYRKVAQSIKDGTIEKQPFQKVFFIGLNALNTCETILMKYYRNNQCAEFFWDYDNFYMDNGMHEAGFFLRDNIREFPSPEYEMDTQNISKPNKNIDIVAVPSDTGQTKVLAKLLDDFNLVDNQDNISTAIVLADENLLMPVVHSIPDHIKKVNITMGYPMQNTGIVNFFQLLFELQRTIRTAPTGGHLFYYRDALAILNHQYFSNEGDKASSLIADIQKNNYFFIDSAKLHFCELGRSVFRNVEKMSDYINYFIDISEKVFVLVKNWENADINSIQLEKEFIYQFYLILKRLNDVLNEEKMEIDMTIYVRMVKKLVQNASVPFIGEPLAGLQIMGALETRGLDFENIIICSMNEGTFPKKSVSRSFIPYNLRKGFGLPTYEHQDAIFAYYFYRLIQRAKNIKLLYNTKTDGFSSGEMSRYIQQLKYDSSLKVNEKNSTFMVQGKKVSPIIIRKDPRVMSKLNNYFKSFGKNKYISPSAINTYLNCPLRFYFNYVADIKEPDEVNEEIDAVMFGNILHKALNLIYVPYVGTKIRTGDLKNLIKDNSFIHNKILEAFKEEYFKNKRTISQIKLYGRNIIIKEIIHKYILQFLTIEEQYAPFEVFSLEDKYKHELPVLFEDNEQIITLGGTIDRIDKYGNGFRIIDYKTGQVSKDFDTVERLFESEKKDRNNAVTQLFIYALIFASNNEDKDILPGLVFTKELFNKDFDFHIIKKGAGSNGPVTDFLPFKQEVEDHLLKTLNSLFNPDIPFIQTSEEKLCRNCSYKDICDRS